VRPLDRRGFLLLLGALPVFAACGGGASPQTVTIAQPLPDAETLNYNLLDTQDKQIGSAQIAIQRQGGTTSLRQLYTRSDGSTDEITVLVDAASLRPQRATRAIASPDLHVMATVTYGNGMVEAVSNDGGKEHRGSAKLTVPAYDDGELIFLMRAIKFEPGYTTHFADVVVDARLATISRVLAELRVAGRTQVRVQGKALPAWEVQFAGAGANATAWYEDAPGRRLLRYANPATTSIELVNP